MTHIEHPSMKRRGTASQPPQQVQRVTTVMNADDEAVLFEQEMAEVEQVTKSQPEVTMEQVLHDPFMEQEEEKRKALEKILLFRKPFTKNIIIKDSTFTLKILNANDNDAIFERVMQLNENEQVSRTPIMVLSAALMSVNGIPIEDLYEGEPNDDILYKKYYEISRWPAPLTKALTRAYNEFSTNMDKEFSAPFLEESPKTDTTDSDGN